MPVAGHTPREATAFETVEHGRCSIEATHLRRFQRLFCASLGTAERLAQVEHDICMRYPTFPNGYRHPRYSS